MNIRTDDLFKERSANLALKPKENFPAFIFLKKVIIERKKIKENWFFRGTKCLPIIIK